MSDQFLDLPIISQLGENQVAHFSQIFVITHSTMDDISHNHPALLTCKFCYVIAVRLCDVMKGHQHVFG